MRTGGILDLQRAPFFICESKRILSRHWSKTTGASSCVKDQFENTGEFANWIEKSNLQLAQWIVEMRSSRFHGNPIRVKSTMVGFFANTSVREGASNCLAVRTEDAKYDLFDSRTFTARFNREMRIRFHWVIV
jgi:hypothetical protein